MRCVLNEIKQIVFWCFTDKSKILLEKVEEEKKKKGKSEARIAQTKIVTSVGYAH